MVDEAHSLGVLGKTGRGIAEHFGMDEDLIDIKMGTLSKTIPAAGGYVAGSKTMTSYLKHEGRAFIYSAALPPPSAAAALEALAVIDDEAWRVEKLQRNYRVFADALRAKGFDLLRTEAAIVPINCDDVVTAWEVARECQRNGVYVQAVVPPVVPMGTARLRACVSAAHTDEEIQTCVSVIEQAGRKYGLIPDAL